MCVRFRDFLFLMNLSLKLSLFFGLLEAVLPISSSPMIIPLLMETTSKTKLKGYGRMAYIYFGCSLNHIFLTLLPFDQFLDQLKNIMVAQLTNFPWSTLEIIIVDVLLKYCTLSFRYIIGIMTTILLSYSDLIFFTTHPSLLL
jgi:hypothetical protein